MSIKVGLISLGCDKNLVDSEYMLGNLKKSGYIITNKEAQADVIIVNTCGFIETAKQESIDTILEMAELKKHGKCKLLIATGCLAQRYSKELLSEIPELDAVIGTGDFDKIDKIIQQKPMERINLTNNKSFLDYDIENRLTSYPYFAFVKIAEGCNNCCTYCTIPQIKGRYKSRYIDSIAREVETLVSQGIREINLVAQDTSCYGKDIYGKPSLALLLKELEKISGNFWIRILYAYPNNINDELLNTIKNSSKIVKYLDIPLQHISDRILKLMNRSTDSRFIKGLIEKIRAHIPDITLRTTFIVGFPTETEEEFNELLDFIRIYEFDRVGAFKYSREENTPAYYLVPQISQTIKEKRYKRLMMLQKTISRKKNKRLEGKTLEVLAEHFDPSTNIIVGRSQKDAPFVDGTVRFNCNSCNLGNFYVVKIKKSLEYDLIGETIQ
ncbi:MAG: 30S ribosomal protein S12 methylthiotransferase RimO [Tepidanaerobacteraceae bacterium]|nr:30S ribosomal protein S12 methylthiotransferase RimO [Tepidanaerobacteraceae bacterium]